MATRSRGSSTHSARTRPSTVQETELEEDGVPKCSGHQRRCKEFTSGRHTKNPGRKFYTCPLGQADPNRCKFFKWADQVDTPNAAGTASPSQSAGPSNTAQTLGKSPAARFGKPTVVVTPTAARTAGDEIDWDKVDTDSLEREAIAASPASSQATTLTMTSAKAVQERLLGAAEGKRKRDDDDNDRTPKRTAPDDNPFLSPNRNPLSPPHPSISPALSSLQELSERLYRQDRLLHAADVAKEGFRKRIQQQQERIEELERRVKELEK